MGQKAVLLLIAAAALMGFLLPAPANRLAALVILAVLIFMYRLTAPRARSGCGSCKGSCSGCMQESVYARYRKDHPLKD